MPHSNRDRALALAGIFQATYLVQQLAKRGTCERTLLEDTLQSLFIMNPLTTEAVYNGVPGVRKGLQLVLNHLAGTSEKRDMEITKYVVSLLYLERKLAKQPAMFIRIKQGLENAQSQLQHFPLLHENVIANIASVYISTISTLTPRITVTGEHGYLTNPEIANQVRALLLAGIRSAVLWSQCGGNRFKLLFGRNKIVFETKNMLTTL